VVGGGDDYGLKRREKAQTTPDTSFGPNVSFFLYIRVLYMLNDFYKYFRMFYTYGWAHGRQEGPGLETGVSRALRGIFFFYSCFFILNDIYRYY
jgi:hypothetical protein